MPAIRGNGFSGESLVTSSPVDNSSTNKKIGQPRTRTAVSSWAAAQMAIAARLAIMASRPISNAFNQTAMLFIERLTPELSRPALRRRQSDNITALPRPRSGRGLNELLAEYAAVEPRLQLYSNSRKESGMAFGRGRQAALAILFPEDKPNSLSADVKFPHSSRDLLKTCLHSANA